MPSFDPINIFKRMWAMRRWGRVLVIATIILTALATVLWFASFWGFFAVSFAVLMWVILFMYYLITTSRLKKSLDELMSRGEWIRGIMGGNTDADFDRNEDHIQQWNITVGNIMKGTEYEQSWKSDVGLVTPEELSKVLGLTLRFLAQRKYMALRLSRLKEIRDSL